MPSTPSLFSRDVMIAGGQRNDLVQMFAFHPELEFAGCVAGVFAALEHGDHYDFDLDRSRRSGLGDKRTCTTKLTPARRKRIVGTTPLMISPEMLRGTKSQQFKTG